MRVNRLVNGRFNQELDNWTVTGSVTHSFAEGSLLGGSAHFTTQFDRVEQEFSVSRDAVYTAHCRIRAVTSDLSSSDASLTIYDVQSTDVVFTLALETLEGVDKWTEFSGEAGLASGRTYALYVIQNGASAEFYLDDIWVSPIPVSRREIAEQVHEKLGTLATALSWSTVPSGTKLEGDYTRAIDAALRSLGALDPQLGTVDIRYVPAESVPALIGEVEQQSLEALRLQYASQVDVKAGPVSESFSQRAVAIGSILGGDGGSSRGPVIIRSLRRS